MQTNAWNFALIFSQFKKTNKKNIIYTKVLGKKTRHLFNSRSRFSFFFFWIPSAWTALKKKKRFNGIVEYYYASLIGRLKKLSRGWKKTHFAPGRQLDGSAQSHTRCVIDPSIHRRPVCECHGLPHLALKVHECMKVQYQQGAIMAWVKVKCSPQSKNARWIEKVKHRTFTWVTHYCWTSDKCW